MKTDTQKAKSIKKEKAKGHSYANQSCCSACGSFSKRENANYCLVCGKTLGEDYQPLDAYRSAHHLQGKSFLVENSKTEKVKELFEVNKNGAAHTTWACFVYSLIPYLGILFIPFTFIFGVAGIAFSFKKSMGGRTLASVSMGLSILVLLLQIFLWWLLYVIPDLPPRY